MRARTLVLIGLILLIVYYLSRPMGRCTNECYIDKMDASVRDAVRSFFRDIERRGYTVVVRDSGRTYEEQAAYKAQDKRNASPGMSSHESGLAMDIDIYKNGKVYSKRTPRSFWVTSGVPQLAKEYGMKWGGNFKGYADNNHFYF